MLEHRALVVTGPAKACVRILEERVDPMARHRAERVHFLAQGRRVVVPQRVAHADRRLQPRRSPVDGEQGGVRAPHSVGRQGRRCRRETKVGVARGQRRGVPDGVSESELRLRIRIRRRGRDDLHGELQAGSALAETRERLGQEVAPGVVHLVPEGDSSGALSHAAPHPVPDGPRRPGPKVRSYQRASASRGEGHRASERSLTARRRSRRPRRPLRRAWRDRCRPPERSRGGRRRLRRRRPRLV